MTELNQLYGPAQTLPTSAVQSLDALADNLTSLPDGQRSPNIRIWGKTLTDYIIFDGLQISQMDFEGLTNVSYFGLQSSDIDHFPPITHLTDLTTVLIDYNRISYVPSLGSLTNLTGFTLNYGSVAEIEEFGSLAKLRSLDLDHNLLTYLPPLNGLTSLTSLKVNDNTLTAQAIDEALAQLVMTAPDNGQFNYSSNPGAPDGQRSTDGAAAKASLVGRGWTITV